MLNTNKISKGSKSLLVALVAADATDPVATMAIFHKATFFAIESLRAAGYIAGSICDMRGCSDADPSEHTVIIGGCDTRSPDRPLGRRLAGTGWILTAAGIAEASR